MVAPFATLDLIHGIQTCFGYLHWNILTIFHRAYTYVNLGLGNEVTGFNISLVEGFNQTGNGTFCWSKTGQAVLQALNITEGQNASIQVIQISHSGASLYNV
jgi:hypothetical protein